MKMNRTLGLGFILYLFLVYATFGLSTIGPSVEGFRQAIAHKDIDKLGMYVDFEALRESIKQQVKSETLYKTAQYSTEMGSMPIGVSEISLAIKLIEDFADAFISRSGVEKLFYLAVNKRVKNEPSAKAQKLLSQLQSKNATSLEEWSVNSLNSLKLIGRSQDGGLFKFVFTFRYYRWVLTDIILDMKDIESPNVVNFIKQFNKELVTGS